MSIAEKHAIDKIQGSKKAKVLNEDSFSDGGFSGRDDGQNEKANQS